MTGSQHADETSQAAARAGRSGYDAGAGAEKGAGAPRVVATAYGEAALAALADVVADAKSADPLATVTLVVPHHTAGVFARRHLAGGIGGHHGIAALHVVTADELARRLTAVHPLRTQPLTPAAVAAAWRRALAAAPGLFSAVARHPATVRALGDASELLRRAGAAALDEIAKASRLTADLVRLHRRVRAALAPTHHDSDAVCDHAAGLLAAGRADPSPLGAVVLYLPQDLAPAQGRLLAALATVAPMTVIAGYTGVRRADSGVDRSLTRMGARPLPAEVAPPTAGRVWHASDCDDEVRLVVRGVARSLASRPGHRVAVLYAAASPYARQLTEQFGQAGIAVAGPGPIPLAESPFGQSFLRLVRFATGSITRLELFALLSTSRLVDPATGEAVPVGRWERIARDAAVVDESDWQIRLDRYRADQQNVGQQNVNAASAHTAAAERRGAEAAALRSFVDALRRRLSSLSSACTWVDLVSAARELLCYFPADTPHGPHAAADAAARSLVEQVLDECLGLAAIETSAHIDDLVETLAGSLESAALPLGRVGDGVLVAPLAAAVGIAVDEVFVVGLAEDILPGRSRVDPLLPDEVRQRAGADLPLAHEEWDARQRHLLAAFTAGARVTACFPRGDLRDGGDRLPSQWLLPTVRELVGDKTLAATDWATTSLALSGSPSFAATLVAGGDDDDRATPAHEQDWRIRSVASGSGLTDPVLAAAFEMRDARAGDEFTRFDGNVAGVDGLPDFGQTPVAPTTLEAYATCPHAYFVRWQLGVQPLAHPEETIAIDHLSIGNLMHECMDRLVTRCADRLPDFGEPWSEEHRAILSDIFDEVAEEAEQSGVTGYPSLWRRDRAQLRAVVMAMLDDDDQWRSDHDARVVASEMPFGSAGFDPVELPLDGGGRVLLHGKADKVDLTRDGVVLVTDLKSGSAARYLDIGVDNPTVNGTKLQLPAYALAARQRFGGTDTPVLAQYWFVRAQKVTERRVPLELTDEVHAEFANAVATLTTAMRRGAFPARAPEHADRLWVQCAYCNPDGVGHAEARERWERKRHHPELRDLVRLIEPDAVPAEAAANDAKEAAR